MLTLKKILPNETKILSRASSRSNIMLEEMGLGGDIDDNLPRYATKPTEKIKKFPAIRTERRFSEDPNTQASVLEKTQGENIDLGIGASSDTKKKPKKTKAKSPDKKISPSKSIGEFLSPVDPESTLVKKKKKKKKKAEDK